MDGVDALLSKLFWTCIALTRVLPAPALAGVVNRLTDITHRARAEQGDRQYTGKQSAISTLHCAPSTISTLRVLGPAIALGLIGSKSSLKGRELAAGNGCAHLRHQMLIVRYIMPAHEHGAQDFSPAHQMVKVGAAELAAGRTCDRLIQWCGILSIPGVSDVDGAKPCECLSRAPGPGGQNAVKEVDSAGDRAH